jgi:tRNA(His) guanylyltransferase
MSGDRTALGDRMKRYERASQTVLPRRTYTIIRVDGRAFHTYLRGARKPYDEPFMADMDRVAAALCQEISGSVLAYTQSDEISVLAVDFQSPNTEPWFAGEVQKVVSIAAATATAALCTRRSFSRPLFDARAFTIADQVEVANYFIWRQRDAVRNSIAMAAQAHFSHNRLHGVSTGQMQELLWSEKGVNWNDYPDGCKRGRVVTRQSGEREVSFPHKRTGEIQTVIALRSWWEPQAAPNFTTQPDGFLATVIPAMPTLEMDTAS